MVFFLCGENLPKQNAGIPRRNVSPAQVKYVHKNTKDGIFQHVEKTFLNMHCWFLGSLFNFLPEVLVFGFVGNRVPIEFALRFVWYGGSLFNGLFPSALYSSPCCILAFRSCIAVVRLCAALQSPPSPPSPPQAAR